MQQSADVEGKQSKQPPSARAESLDSAFLDMQSIASTWLSPTKKTRWMREKWRFSVRSFISFFYIWISPSDSLNVEMFKPKQMAKFGTFCCPNGQHKLSTKSPECSRRQPNPKTCMNGRFNPWPKLSFPLPLKLSPELVHALNDGNRKSGLMQKS